jgi:hypothetical protein
MIDALPDGTVCFFLFFFNLIYLLDGVTFI